MYRRLNQHLQVNNILVTEEQSFRKDLSTEHATYSLIYGILHAWNSKIHFAGIFLSWHRHSVALIIRF